MKTQYSERVSGMIVYTMDRHQDGRGFFEEIYNGSLDDYPYDGNWVQANHSVSRKYVLRGIHKSHYNKLVTCFTGRVYDVVVDLRPESSTYGNWDAIELDGVNRKEIFVPRNCGHAYLALENESHIFSLQSGVCQPEQEEAIYWKSPVLGIMWPIACPSLSPRDSRATILYELPIAKPSLLTRLMALLKS
jgi:dTDP-4-dehydrorhamnose 3,5-epimerase